MQLEMIECPKCGNDFPLKRKELGYHVCINCSTTKPVVGVTTIEGTGDHTYNDLIIMDQDKFLSIARKAAELSGARPDTVEMIDFDIDESEVTQSVKEKVARVLDDEEEEDTLVDENTKFSKIQGIDF